VVTEEVLMSQRRERGIIGFHVQAKVLSLSLTQKVREENQIPRLECPGVTTVDSVRDQSSSTPPILDLSTSTAPLSSSHGLNQSSEDTGTLAALS
jgi:hypothetical protein